MKKTILLAVMLTMVLVVMSAPEGGWQRGFVGSVNLANVFDT